jgi:hypothetical protein
MRWEAQLARMTVVQQRLCFNCPVNVFKSVVRLLLDRGTSLTNVASQIAVITVNMRAIQPQVTILRCS